ncbi:phage tail terminator protein [Oceanospirillum maris]|uniref:phage tail terminator protein n=1 Tax=Oceanospirillum maris TaxID=64977 RepID=UPI000404874F|nr:hypothetical protein [Oceanospirillum maris]
MIDRSNELIGMIESQCPAFVTVDCPWFMDALDELDKELPAALVWLSGDGAVADEPASLVTTQQVMQTYGVWVIASRNHLDQSRTELRKTLLGWVPDEMSGDVRYVKGGAENISGDIVWWREYWALPVWIRQG